MQLIGQTIASGRLPQRDQTQLDQALAAYDAGKDQEAEPLLRDLVSRYPSNFAIAETLGLIYAQRGEMERALPLLESGCRANPKSPEAAANVGAAYVRLNRIKDAIRELRRAVSLDPKNSQTQSSYGQALMMAERPRDAVKAFAAASSSNPRNPDVLYNWALAEFQSGDPRQASEILARIPPLLQSAQAASLCGDAEEQQGHLARALACFQSAAKLDPSEPNLNALGVELLRHWSFDAATKVYGYAAGRYPSSAKLQTGLGIAFYGAGHYEDSARVFSRLLASDANQASYAKSLGQSCIALKAESEDCSVLFRYVDSHPADSAAASLAAGAILEWHDTAKYTVARKYLDKAIAENPRSADSYYRMGVLDQAEGNWTDSVLMLRRAAALRPTSSKTHLHLAEAYAHLDEREHAHQEAVLARRSRQDEDSGMDAKREQLKTFILTTQ